MSGTLVLLSGGVDSMVVAELLLQRSRLGGCLFVDYGHPAQVPEAWKAFEYCLRREVPLKVVHVFGLGLGEMGTQQGARVVPARNAVLLACAANVAPGLKCDRIALGVIGDDYDSYADCRREFLAAMSSAIGMPIDAPLIDFRKIGVMRLASDMNLLDHTWSCYTGGPAPCGTCPSCQQRQNALENLGKEH